MSLYDFETLTSADWPVNWTLALKLCYVGGSRIIRDHAVRRVVMDYNAVSGQCHTIADFTSMWIPKLPCRRRRHANGPEVTSAVRLEHFLPSSQGVRDSGLFAYLRLPFIQ